MPEHIQYQDDELFNPETRHEHSDVPVRPLWIAIAIFLVFGVVSYLAVWLLYKGFVRSENERAEAPATAVQRPSDVSVPKNQPLLQPFPKTGNAGETVPPQRNTPVTDLHEMRAAEDAVLHHYGWVDRQQGVVHIPIEVAKDRAVEMLQRESAAVPAGETAATSTAASAPAPAEGAPRAQ